MAKNKICDFCLDEPKGFFNHPEELPDHHYICKNCRRIIESYGLPVQYDLFQMLVTADPAMRDMLMGTYLESNQPEECLKRFYPESSMALHKGEHCLSECDASVTVRSDLIPVSDAPVSIAGITRHDIVNLSDCTDGSSREVHGRLVLTDAALYFLSPHFINCHRIADINRSSEDTKAVHVLERSVSFTYRTEHADMIFMREAFHQKLMEKLSRKKNLIYIASENTMTLTPGVYHVPKNIQAGTYWVSAVNDKGLHVRDAAGTVRGWKSGRLRLDEGSQLEVTGEYQFRINRREEQNGEMIYEAAEEAAPIGEMVQDSTQVLVLRSEQESQPEMHLRLPDDLTSTAALPLIDDDLLKKYGID